MQMMKVNGVLQKVIPILINNRKRKEHFRSKMQYEKESQSTRHRECKPHCKIGLYTSNEIQNPNFSSVLEKKSPNDVN